MESSHRGARPAFTLVELLVVITIIGILMSLLLPAVQAAREAARRSQCANNLKQMGLALHNFENTFKVYPPGGISGSTSTEAHEKFGIPANRTHGWAVFLLPYLEQKPLYDLYDFKKDWTMNKTVIETSVAAFKCPSTPDGNRKASKPAGAIEPVSPAVADYGVDNAINTALEPMGLIDKASANAPHGIMQVNTVQMAADVRDGLSNTMCICEDAGRPREYLARGVTGTSTTVSGAAWADRDNEYITHGYTDDGSKSPGPCPINCTNQNEIYSFHPSGAMVLFVDGSAHFLPDSTSIRVVGRLLTRAGGEVVEIP